MISVRDRINRILHNDEPKPLSTSKARERWGRGYTVFDAIHATTDDFDSFHPEFLGTFDPGWQGRGYYFHKVDADFIAKNSRKNSSGADWRMHEPDDPSNVRENYHQKLVVVRFKKLFTEKDAANPKVAKQFAALGYKAISWNLLSLGRKAMSVNIPGDRPGLGMMSYDKRIAAIKEDANKFTEVAVALGYDGASWRGELVVFPGFENNIRYRTAKFDPAMDHSSVMTEGERHKQALLLRKALDGEE